MLNLSDDDIKNMLELAEKAMESEENQKKIQDIYAEVQADPEVTAQTDENMKQTMLFSKLAGKMIPFASTMMGEQWKEFGIDDSNMMMALMQIQMKYATLDEDSKARAKKIMDLVQGKVASP